MSEVHRFFLAIIPPAHLAEEITSMKQLMSQRFGSHAALRSPPHITLHMPFQWKEKRLEELQEGLEAFAKQCTPFDITLKDFSCFPPRVIFIHVEESAALNSLHENLSRHCRQSFQLFNTDYRNLPFHPHVTIGFRDLKKNVFHEAWAFWQQQRMSTYFTCTSFHLLKHDGKKWNPFMPFSFQSH